MAGKNAKTAAGLGKEVPKRHYCPTHDEVCKPVMVVPGHRTMFECPQGHKLSKRETVLKY